MFWHPHHPLHTPLVGAYWAADLSYWADWHRECLHCPALLTKTTLCHLSASVETSAARSCSAEDCRPAWRTSGSWRVAPAHRQAPAVYTRCSVTKTQKLPTPQNVLWFTYLFKCRLLKFLLTMFRPVSQSNRLASSTKGISTNTQVQVQVRLLQLEHSSI